MTTDAVEHAGQSKTPVHDTATVTGNQPDKTPGGDRDFFMCSFAAGTTDTCDDSDAGHHGSSIGTGTLAGSGAVATADSPDVNTVASPLTPGRYCFRAEWPGDAQLRRGAEGGRKR